MLFGSPSAVKKSEERNGQVHLSTNKKKQHFFETTAVFDNNAPCFILCKLEVAYLARGNQASV